MSICIYIWVSYVTNMYTYGFTRRAWRIVSHVTHMMSHVTHINESCHTCEWFMSHIWVSHVTHMYICMIAQDAWEGLRVMSHIWVRNVTHMMSHVTHMSESCQIYEWVMSHIWVSHVTHLSESCHTYEWVMAHIWVSYVTHMSESWQTYEWVMSHIWMSHVTHMNESCHTYEWVMSHIWMSHVTHMNESCHTYEWVMSHIWMSHIYGWFMLHVSIRHALFAHIDQSSYSMCANILCVQTWRGELTRATWIIHTIVIFRIWRSNAFEDMPHIWMRHVTCMNELWHIRPMRQW